MQNNDIINSESILESDRKESSYKIFHKPEIIYKPKNQIVLLPRIKNFRTIELELDKANKSHEGYEPNNNDIKQKKNISLSENKKFKITKSIHNLKIDTKKYPNLVLNSLSNKHNSKINNLKQKSLVSASRNQNIKKLNETDDNNNNINSIDQNIEKRNMPNIFNISQDKAKSFFRFNKLPKLKIQPLESIFDKINTKSIDNDSIYKITDLLKFGSKYDPKGVNTIEEEEKVEFNERIKSMMSKMSLKKTRSRNTKNRNVYEILEDLKKKKVSDCTKLVQKTSKEVQMYRKKMDKMYNNFKKSFDNEVEWNNKTNLFDIN